MNTRTPQQQKGWTLRGLVGILVLAGLAGCSTLAPPLVAPNASRGPVMEKWDVEPYLAEKNSTARPHPGPAESDPYPTFLNEAMEFYHAKRSELRKYVSQWNDRWTQLTHTLSGE